LHKKFEGQAFVSLPYFVILRRKTNLSRAEHSFIIYISHPATPSPCRQTAGCRVTTSAGAMADGNGLFRKILKEECARKTTEKFYTLHEQHIS